ncbi:StfH/YfcO family fimbrial adhesin [Escherichia albertii]|nr:StfH/YfcO family fimbrial adhesin [Escherichia albertii]MCZ8554118.1 StfH/YfcO family fimbrial adhesin [Escherichia albertii]MCZ8558287.1 StfH/YfcO family fimbrial adhesin [Escherichia albertii]MCZ8562612.1 StfH/YfcO family fimbrial adhesin [Escherichia albertii]MCZ8566927.1 StfH/YfcO family fimbrial adhesin [Escherichia albertii]MCZ8575744.1 StfH/YfcO family fimbrial adhesin [Escherichia albertii]
MTDKQLHDMVLQVNTSNNVPAIAATCRFQYILNEL